MENKSYVNPYEDVHRKARAVNDHARKIREEETETRERNTQRAIAAAAAAEDAGKKTR
jgi:hypothetical protein